MTPKQRLGTLQRAFGGELPENLSEVLCARKRELEDAEQRCKMAERDVEETQKERDCAQKALHSQEQRLGEIRQRLAGVRATMEAALRRLRALPDCSALSDLPPPTEEVPQQLDTLSQWNAATLEAGLHAQAERQRRAETAIHALRQLASGEEVTVSSDAPAQALADLNHILGKAQRQLGEKEEEHKQLARRVEEREKKQDELAKTRKKQQNYQRLGQELQADRFLAFLISEGLQHLAIAASRELAAVSGNRYELKASGRDFVIIDHANADEERCTATLSGGETFLASLSLALALSGSLTQLAGHTAAAKLDAVFIDEGFGSIDAQSLEVVVDALERLQEGDRMVGVITHVPLLAERIPNGLEVERVGSSSRVIAR